MAKQTFVMDFGGGITCTTIVNPTRLMQDKNHVVGMEWSIKPTRDQLAAVLPRYREWIHSINQVMVDKTRKTVLYCLQTGRDEWEVWSYKPDASPERVNFSEGRQ